MSYHDKLVEVAMAARACVEWTTEHDPVNCSHGAIRTECRACWEEPEPFPVGIDEWCQLKGALISAGLLPPMWGPRPRPVTQTTLRMRSTEATIQEKKT